MRLLVDQNLSPRLCDRPRDIWTEIVDVRAVGLAAADDSTVWAFAKQQGFTIVSKDGDLSGRSVLYGAPPKVIWLAVGNCSTREIERHLRGHREDIETFAAEPDTALLVIETGIFTVR